MPTGQCSRDDVNGFMNSVDTNSDRTALNQSLRERDTSQQGGTTNSHETTTKFFVYLFRVDSCRFVIHGFSVPIS
jgi:hypothetical protein